MPALKDAVQSMNRNRLMVAVSVGTITIALILLGVIGVVTFAAQKLVEHFQQSEEVNVYIRDDASDGDLLAADAAIRALPEVGSTTIMTKDDAKKEFERVFGSDLLRDLKQNPLPRSIIIRMAEGHNMSDDRESLVSRIRDLKGVESVEYGVDWLAKLDIFFIMFLLIETAVLLLIVSAVILIISNTITLTVIARKDEIEIMQLVGATGGVIKRPFYFEGILQGTVSGCIAFLAFWGLAAWIARAFPDIDLYLFLSGLMGIEKLPFIDAMVLIIPFGAVFGFLGSYVALRRTL